MHPGRKVYHLLHSDRGKKKILKLKLESFQETRLLDEHISSAANLKSRYTQSLSFSRSSFFIGDPPGDYYDRIIAVETISLKKHNIIKVQSAIVPFPSAGGV